MKGPELIESLEKEGFSVSRRSKTLVWLKRGEEQLLIDSVADVDEQTAKDILTQARRARKN